LLDVSAVNDEIEGDGEAMPPEPFEDAQFLCVGFGAGDFLCCFFVGALEAELEMIEAGLN
jgi:hypothetical protein